MNTFKSALKIYLKRPWIIAGLVLVLIIVGYFVFRNGSTGATEDTIKVKSGTVSEEVSVTGKVKPATAVDLSFEKSGRVILVSKEVGEQVKTAEIIVRVDASDLAAELAQANAQVKVQQAKLSELVAGTRPETLRISEIKVANAESDVLAARSSLLSASQSAYTSADDAIRNKIDEFFINPRSDNPQVAFRVTITPETSIESGRVEVERRLEKLKPAVSNATTSDNLLLLSARVKQDLAEIKLFLDNLSLAVNALTPTLYAPQATITQWKGYMSTARTEINSAITSILAAEDKLKLAQSALSIAKSQLSLDVAGRIAQEIEAQQASVAQAEANAAVVNVQYRKTFLRAPIDGIITKQEAKLGETISPNVIVVSLMSNTKFEIEADVAEADIAKLKIGQEAKVTLDAYGQDVPFRATIVMINPAETVIDGVPTYKTTFQFSVDDARIKSGMTANIDIQGESHENVLSVPQRAIISRNGGKYVITVNNDIQSEVQVKTGLRGFDGSIEITEGLSEGDTVVINQPK